jgi:hypothetical protein
MISCILFICLTNTISNDDEWNDMDDGATVTSEYIFSMDISKIKIGLFAIA